ncbi:MAG TPA: DUF3137 domain-containing protein [Thermoanaerobaculia bacterium]|nr:DUF3137 domain-containing protein [Thermoanaerobaculia bacterium]
MSVLRKMFGPSHKEIWRQLSAEVEGRYIDGGFWKGDKVAVAHEEWTVTLDKYVVSTGKVLIVYTRMRAPYVNADGFRFAIHRKGFFSNIGKWLGMQDIDIGHQPFDEDFIIRSNDEHKVRALLSNARLRELIAAQRTIHFSVKDDEGWFGPTFPNGVDELVFLVTGVITDIGHLKQLYEMFGETLDELCRIGSAYEDAPGISL